MLACTLSGAARNKEMQSPEAGAPGKVARLGKVEWSLWALYRKHAGSWPCRCHPTGHTEI